MDEDHHGLASQSSRDHRSGGVNKLTHYLVGDLLNITSGEVGRLAVACALIAVWLCWSYNRVLFTGLNETLARSRCAQHC